MNNREFAQEVVEGFVSSYFRGTLEQKTTAYMNYTSNAGGVYRKLFLDSLIGRLYILQDS
jgi:hypothetical protein